MTSIGYNRLLSSLGYSSLIPLLGSDPLTKRVVKAGPRIQVPLISAQGLGSPPAHLCPALPGNHAHLELSSNLGTVASTPESAAVPTCLSWRGLGVWAQHSFEGIVCCCGPPCAPGVVLGESECEHSLSITKGQTEALSATGKAGTLAGPLSPSGSPSQNQVGRCSKPQLQRALLHH